MYKQKMLSRNLTPLMIKYFFKISTINSIFVHQNYYAYNNVSVSNNLTQFTLIKNGIAYKTFTTKLMGEYNIQNLILKFEHMLETHDLQYYNLQTLNFYYDDQILL